jgi:hypothetical protein
MPRENRPPARNPHGLPTKICAGCGRPFTWRKKWARDWEAVRYCSERCRRAGGRRRWPTSGGGAVLIPAHKDGGAENLPRRRAMLRCATLYGDKGRLFAAEVPGEFLL